MRAMDPVEMLISAANVAMYVAEGIGVLVIVLGVLLALIRFAAHPRTLESDGAYDRLRRELGRSIIIGLEFLVAAEVVRTVVIERTMENIIVLAVIVLVRTLLSFALFVEVEGRWPWRSAAPASNDPGTGGDAGRAT
jgi:uncharacterized membrane protein